MKKFLIVGIVVLVVIIALLVSVFAVFTFDLMSYGATASETLNPVGTPVGSALVVYNPGLSGSAKQAATIIAGDFQTKGYTVDLAGVRSKTATNSSSYDIIVVGGPMYFGKATSSIEGYLKTLSQQQPAKLGVFVTTGSSQYQESDFLSLQQQVASATNHQATIRMILNGNETQNCADLTAALLQ
jgi:menaquinone-dependent protoporphyrinogen IX oxidase